MGGKLWNLGRMPRDKYLEIEREVRLVLDEVIPGDWQIPRYLLEKTDFGDLDVLVADEAIGGGTQVDRIADHLAVLGSQRKKVGAIWSTVVSGLQVDFFPFPRHALETVRSFMDYGEIGNVVGRMARRLGCTFGERGLAYVYRWSDHYRHDVPLTSDFTEVCRFFGLDYAKWRSGFFSRREMFDWLVSSPYFDPSPYVRDDGRIPALARARTGMAAFVEYVRKMPPLERTPVADPIEVVALGFPEVGLREIIADQDRKTARIAAVASKFNGRVVMAVRPDLYGRTLGEFITRFQGSRPDFYDWVIRSTPDEVKTAIGSFEG